MLFSSSTNLTNEMGAVSTSTFDGIGVYVIVIIGVVLGFYILERLVTAIFPKYYSEIKNDV